MPKFKLKDTIKETIMRDYAKEIQLRVDWLKQKMKREEHMKNLTKNGKTSSFRPAFSVHLYIVF